MVVLFQQNQVYYYLDITVSILCSKLCNIAHSATATYIIGIAGGLTGELVSNMAIR